MLLFRHCFGVLVKAVSLKCLQIQQIFTDFMIGIEFADRVPSCHRVIAVPQKGKEFHYICQVCYLGLNDELIRIQKSKGQVTVTSLAITQEFMGWVAL